MKTIFKYDIIDVITSNTFLFGLKAQGGDPTGTGTGGESAWGKPFEDEIRGSLHHEGRG